MGDHAGRDAVAAVWRIESARIVGALVRYTGEFALAEDLAQEALAEALVNWPRDGVPRNPAGSCSPSDGAVRSTRSGDAPPEKTGTPPSPAGWARKARTALSAAVRLCGNERERSVLERKLGTLG